MKLREALLAKPEGERLLQVLDDDVRREAEVRLRHVSDLFPTFTDHTVSPHCDDVIAILDWLVPDQVKTDLTAWEIYFLIAAAYLHDIGMVEACPSSPIGSEWEKFLADFRRENDGLDESSLILQAKRDFVRSNHHLRSEEYIRQAWRELGLRASGSDFEGAIVGRIARGHRKEDLANDELFSTVPYGVQNQAVRRRLLSGYLRIADELDTTAKRTPAAEYELLPVLDSVSELEWEKHLSLAGVREDRGVLLLGGECHDFDLFLRLTRLTDEIREKLLTVRMAIGRDWTLTDGSQQDPLPYHDVQLRVEHVGYLPIEMRFNLDVQKVVELLLGERLYEDHTISLRELLQNAVDACNEARAYRPSGWRPGIVVSLDSDLNQLSVTDNGIGMDESIIRNYLARIPSSYYESNRAEFSPIGEFGIGLLSCFMVADEIEIDSLREGRPPIAVKIRGTQEPFVPSRGTRSTPGTAIRLSLKAGAFDEMKLRDSLRSFVRHVAVPVTFRASGGDWELSREPLYPDALSYEGWHSFKRWPMEQVLDLFRATYATASMPGLKVGVAIGPRGLPPSSTLSNQGFLVTANPDQIQRIAPASLVEVNLTGRQVARMKMDRSGTTANSDEVLWRSTAELYSECIEDIYQRFHGKQIGDTGLEEIPADMGQEFLEGVSSWWGYHLRHYPSWMEAPSALIQSAHQGASFCVVTREGFEQWTAEQLVSSTRRRFFVPYQRHDLLGRFWRQLGDDLAVVHPPVDGFLEASWIQALISEGVVRASRWKPHLRVDERSILGRRMYFAFGAGPIQDHWRIDPELYGSPVRVMVDGSHWFSSFLLTFGGRLPHRARPVLTRLLDRRRRPPDDGELAAAMESLTQQASADVRLEAEAWAESAVKEWLVMSHPEHDCVY